MNKIDLYKKINHLIHKAGFDVRRFPEGGQRRLLKYLQTNDTNDCFDIGANTGQFALLLRSAGFKGNIFSFEPQTKAFENLERFAAADPKWKAYNIGLGNVDEKSIINLSKNSVSSSILDINKILTDTEPETEYISREEITILRLDSFLKEMNFSKKIFLKIDAQGYESKILEGLGDCFEAVYALQIELSCIPLYEGEKLFDEMKDFIESKGFFVSSLESGFADALTGRLLQAEAIFLRDVVKTRIY
ncbi:MAG: FkbM family methyltransferase [Ginsengibacter sp.]